MCQDMDVGKCIFWATFWQGASIFLGGWVTEMKRLFFPLVLGRLDFLIRLFSLR